MQTRDTWTPPARSHATDWLADWMTVLKCTTFPNLTIRFRTYMPNLPDFPVQSWCFWLMLQLKLHACAYCIEYPVGLHWLESEFQQLRNAHLQPYYQANQGMCYTCCVCQRLGWLLLWQNCRVEGHAKLLPAKFFFHRAWYISTTCLHFAQISRM